MGTWRTNNKPLNPSTALTILALSPSLFFSPAGDLTKEMEVHLLAPPTTPEGGDVLWREIFLHNTNKIYLASFVYYARGQIL
jgi:hypothetical protein